MPTKFNWWKRLLLIFSIIMVPKLIPKTFSISWNKNSNVAAFMSNWKSAVHQSEQSQLRYIFYFFCMKTNCMIKYCDIFQQLRTFLIEKKDAEFIFIEHETAGTLKKPTRCQLIGFIADLINEQYCSAKQKEISNICHATIELFPSLQDGNGGIVGFFLLIFEINFCFLSI